MKDALPSTPDTWIGCPCSRARLSVSVQGNPVFLILLQRALEDVGKISD